MVSRRAWLAVLAGAVLSPSIAWAQLDPATVPEAKRTRAEAMYVGMAEPVDALVPYVEHQELMTDWDEQRRLYRLEPLQDFVPEVARRLQARGLGQQDVVVLICRSGDRSSRGANRLAEDGYTRVYSVVDGFEGDLSKDGRRSVNGWKNAGLPWSCRLDKARLYFPR